MNAGTVDVAILGGGPAGLSAAITLRRQDLQVVVFEAGDYPRHKLCGEFLSPECAGMLADLGAGELVAACHPARCHPAAIQTVRLTAPGGIVWEAGLPGTALGLSRYILDAGLAEQACAEGAQVRTKTPARRAAGSLEDGFIVEAGRERLRARAVIGAHGKRSRLDRALQRPFSQRRHPFLALKAHMHGPPTAERIELHGFPGGYCGISAVEGGGQNVCLLVREETFQQHAYPQMNAIPAFLAWMQSQNQALGEWMGQAQPVFEAWMSISQIAFGAKEAMVGDMLMAGDAAQLIAPLAGSGIGMALESGILAGRLLAGYLHGSLSPGELRRAYPHAWRQRFAPRLRLAGGLQSLMLEPGRLRLGLHLLNILPGVGMWLIDKSFKHRRLPAG